MNDKIRNALHSKKETGGIFTFYHKRDGVIIDTWEQHNIVPEAALDYINNSSLRGATAISVFYIALFSNAYTPQSDDLYSHIGTRFDELDAEYDEVTRPVWTTDGPSAVGVVTNSASRAVFTFNQSATVSGGLLVSNNVKSDNTSGTLIASTAHIPARAVIAADQLLVLYSITSTSS